MLKQKCKHTIWRLFYEKRDEKSCRGGGNCAVKFGFTLAEVLITLGIIGVVAALTLPTVIANYQEKVLVSKIKKAYSSIQNAIILAQQDSGNIGDNEFLFNSSDGFLKVTENFAKYFNGAKVCKKSQDCKDKIYQIKWADSPSYNSSGNATEFGNMAPMIILNDGCIVRVSELTPNCDNVRTETTYNKKGEASTRENHVKYCAIVYFDVNGALPPNQFGQDNFSFTVFKDKIAPGNWSKTGGKTLKNILSGNEKIQAKRQ